MAPFWAKMDQWKSTQMTYQHSFMIINLFLYLLNGMQFWIIFVKRYWLWFWPHFPHFDRSKIIMKTTECRLCFQTFQAYAQIFAQRVPFLVKSFVNVTKINSSHSFLMLRTRRSWPYPKRLGTGAQRRPPTATWPWPIRPWEATRWLWSTTTVTSTLPGNSKTWRARLVHSAI